MPEWKLKRRANESDEEYAARVEARHQHTLEKHRKYRESHRELYRECSRKAYYKDIEKSRARNREYEKKNRAKRKLKDDAWREKNRLYVAERARRYRHAHYDHRRAVEKAYYARTANHRKEWWKDYRKKNKDRLSAEFKKWDAERQKKFREEVASFFSISHDTSFDENSIYGVVYLVANVCTDRFYIGQAVCVKNRYKSGIKSFIKDAETRSHSKVLDDFSVFGVESFTGPEIIAVAHSKEELNFLEAHYINVYDSFNAGYNQTRGNIRSVFRKTHKKENT